MSGALAGAAGVRGGLARGFASAPVSLGAINLTGVEVPSEISFAGEQSLIVHKLPGGDRVINLFGGDPTRITLAGMFAGPLASERYAQIEAMRDGAATQTLVAAGRALQVIIAACRVRYQQRGAVLPYEVELEVVPQLASSQPTDGTASFAGLTASDAATALAAVQTALVLGNADAGLTSAASALAPLSSAVAGSAAYVAALNSAGAGLSVSLAANGDTITTIAEDAANGVCADAASLASAVEAAGLIAGAAQAGGYVNRALAGLTTAGPLPVPLVHA